MLLLLVRCRAGPQLACVPWLCASLVFPCVSCVALHNCIAFASVETGERWRSIIHRSKVGQAAGRRKSIDACKCNAMVDHQRERGHASCYVPRHDLCLSACPPFHCSLSFPFTRRHCLSLSSQDDRRLNCPLSSDPLSLRLFLVHPFQHLSSVSPLLSQLFISAQCLPPASCILPRRDAESPGNLPRPPSHPPR